MNPVTIIVSAIILTGIVMCINAIIFVLAWDDDGREANSSYNDK